MNIVHVTRYYAPAWGFGGVVRAVHGLTVAQAQQGHNVTVLTTDAADAAIGRLPVGETDIDGVHVIRCRNVSAALHRANLSTPLGFGRKLRVLLSSADVLHLHELRTVENLIALRLAQQIGVPVVMSPHGTLGYEAGRTSIKQLWDRIFGGWMAQRITAVAALTTYERDETASLWAQVGVPVRVEQMHVIPNGVDPSEFTSLPDKGHFRTKWQVPADAPLLLFLGRLHVRKGVHLLIEALPTLPNVHLAAVGKDEGQLADLQALVASLGVTDRVHLTGLLTGQDKLSVLRDADLLALPAVGEGLPMVALEAMACGLSVALSDGCHLPEVIEAGAGVHLPELNGSAIADALRPVMVDAACREKMGTIGKTMISERYTWQRVAAAFIDLYQTLG